MQWTHVTHMLHISSDDDLLIWEKSFPPAIFPGLGIRKIRWGLVPVNMKNKWLSWSATHSIWRRRCRMNEPVQCRGAKVPFSAANEAVSCCFLQSRFARKSPLLPLFLGLQYVVTDPSLIHCYQTHEEFPWIALNPDQILRRRPLCGCEQTRYPWRRKVSHTQSFLFPVR